VEDARPACIAVANHENGLSAIFPLFHFPWIHSERIQVTTSNLDTTTSAAHHLRGIGGIDSQRLWKRLMRLGEIGALEGGGVNRQALSEAEIAAWRYLIALATQGAGRRIEASTDAAGNLFLTLPGRNRDLPPVLLGSHLDSQPAGGRFDGAYGVLSALEVLLTRAERGLDSDRDLVAVGWMNEEGSRFAPGMMGSQAFAGGVGVSEIRTVCDADGISVGTALDHLHTVFSDLPRRALGFPVAAYFELHIEQGPLLEAAGMMIGVVNGIQGKKTWRIEIDGESGHAGTLAMRDRRDALAAFARVAVALDGELGAVDEQVKFTIGRAVVEPNAPSVVPHKVAFSIDLRHPDNAVLTRLGMRAEALCLANAGPCSVRVVPLVDAPSNGFDPRLGELIEAAASTFEYSSMPILSAAGHDARYLAQVAPSAMIFIPCRAGISHSPAEWSTPKQVGAGADVLYATLEAWLQAQNQECHDA
jgi:N-carbamoyl-L-amino-acid hydrolase